MAAPDFWLTMLQHFGAIALFAFALYMSIKRIGEPLVRRHIAFLDTLESRLAALDIKQQQILDAVFRKRPPFYQNEDDQ